MRKLTKTKETENADKKEKKIREYVQEFHHISNTKFMEEELKKLSAMGFQRTKSVNFP